MVVIKIKNSDWKEIYLNNKDTFPKGESLYYYVCHGDVALYCPPEKSCKLACWQFLRDGESYVRNTDQYVEIDVIEEKEETL